MEPEEAGSSCWYTDRKFTISITAFLLILPLSIPKEIGFQKYARWVVRALWGWELGWASRHPPQHHPGGQGMKTPLVLAPHLPAHPWGVGYLLLRLPVPQFPHLGSRGAAEHCEAAASYSGACVPPFHSLEEAGRAAFSCVVPCLWSWPSSRQQSQEGSPGHMVCRPALLRQASGCLCNLAAGAGPGPPRSITPLPLASLLPRIQPYWQVRHGTAQWDGIHISSGDSGWQGLAYPRESGEQGWSWWEELGWPGLCRGEDGAGEAGRRPSTEQADGLLSPLASSLSVIGTWYVTAVIIIKYIWPDKELVPVEIPTRWAQETRCWWWPSQHSRARQGVREQGLQRLGTNPSWVPSLGLGTLHVAAGSSRVAASLRVSEEQVVKERRRTSWRSPRLHRRFGGALIDC